jgi:flagellar hook-associated protein 2
VTLSLKAAGSVSVEVTRDGEAVRAAVQKFVDAYNALRTEIGKARTGDLKGDSALLGIESGLLGVLNTAASGLAGGYRYLSELGVSLQKDGSMALDAADFDAALAADFNAVAQVFGHATQGFAVRLDAQAGRFLAADGLIDGRLEGINDRIAELGRREERLEWRLESVEKRMRAQFGALDSLVAQLRSTGDFLTAQLSQIGQLNK